MSHLMGPRVTVTHSERERDVALIYTDLYMHNPP